MFDEDWIKDGLYQGRIVRNAESALNALSSAFPLTIEILEAVSGNENLELSLKARSLIDDIKLGRNGGEWEEERDAIAKNAVQTFSETHSQTVFQLRQSHLVAITSCLENYVKSLLVEFPKDGVPMARSQRNMVCEPEEVSWEIADRLYRKARKDKESESKAWAWLCEVSSIPMLSKTRVIAWSQSSDGYLIDKMVLTRNSIIHNAGLTDLKLAKQSERPIGERVTVTSESMGDYSRAYWGFICALEESF